MKNFLKNLYTKLEKENQKMLTPHEQTIADSIYIFLSHEINEMSNIIVEEEKAQKEAMENPDLSGRTHYDLNRMKNILDIVNAVNLSIGMLIAKTSENVMQRSKSNIAKLIMTPQDLCHARSERKLDMSTISPIHPHEIQDYKGAVPEPFKMSMKRIHSLIDQENVFGVFAPIYPLLGKNIQKLYIITGV